MTCTRNKQAAVKEITGGATSLSVDELEQCLETIVEMTQGPCTKNQDALMKYRVLDEIIRLVNACVSNSTVEGDPFSELRALAVGAIQALIEGYVCCTVTLWLMAISDSVSSATLWSHRAL